MPLSTTKVISRQLLIHMFPGFLTPVIHKFLSQATVYFSHMLQRWEVKIHRQESLPRLGWVSNSWPLDHESDRLNNEISVLVWKWILWQICNDYYQSLESRQQFNSCTLPNELSRLGMEIRNKIMLWLWWKRKIKQEGQDGPGSLTWIFERTIVNYLFIYLFILFIYLFIYFFFLGGGGKRGRASEKKNFEGFLHVRIMQVATIHQCFVHWWIKISRIISDNCHPRNISVKLFQNLICGFREEIFKNFSMSIWCKSPPFTRAMLIDESQFANNFWGRSLKEHFCNIISIFKEFLHVCKV